MPRTTVPLLRTTTARCRTVLGTALFVLVQACTVVPYAFVCLLMAPMPRPVRYKVTMGWPRAMIWAARALCGIRWRIEGLEHLPNGPAVLLAKHQSTWETFFLPSFLPRELCFVFKRELLWIPFFGWGLALLEMIHIDRARGRDAFSAIVAQGQRVLDQGRWIILFPEGTRMPPGTQGRYKTGGARLAIQTAVPVVPIAINAGALWPKTTVLKHPGCVTVAIGPAISSVGQTPEALMTRVEQWIETTMRRLHPEAYDPPPTEVVHETT